MRRHGLLSSSQTQGVEHAPEEPSPRLTAVQIWFEREFHKEKSSFGILILFYQLPYIQPDSLAYALLGLARLAMRNNGYRLNSPTQPL